MANQNEDIKEPIKAMFRVYDKEKLVEMLTDVFIANVLSNINPIDNQLGDAFQQADHKVFVDQMVRQIKFNPFNYEQEVINDLKPCNQSIQVINEQNLKIAKEMEEDLNNNINQLWKI